MSCPWDLCSTPGGFSLTLTFPSLLSLSYLFFISIHLSVYLSIYLHLHPCPYLYLYPSPSNANTPSISRHQARVGKRESEDGVQQGIPMVDLVGKAYPEVYRSQPQNPWSPATSRGPWQGSSKAKGGAEEQRQASPRKRRSPPLFEMRMKRRVTGQRMAAWLRWR